MHPLSTRGLQQAAGRMHGRMGYPAAAAFRWAPSPATGGPGQCGESHNSDCTPGRMPIASE
jgi:hypothetical protein